MNKRFLSNRMIPFRTEECILLLTRLSLFLSAGIPLLEALLFIEEATSTTKQQVVRALITSVTEGRPLSEAFRAYPYIFNAFTQSLIEAGEASGTLAGCLATCAHHLRERQNLRRKILSALLYPCIIVGATIAVSIFLTLYAFPKMVPILKGFKTTLPFPTRALISLNELIVQNGIYVFLALLITLAGIVYVFRYEYVRTRADGALLRIPLFGTLAQLYELTIITRTLSLLLRGGTHILPALALVARSAENRIYRASFAAIQRDVLKGGRLADAFRAHRALFPFFIIQMTSAGEATGTLPESLASVGDVYERELDELTRNLTTLIEPVLMILMGLVVGFVALAIITPIYRVTEGLDIS